MIEIPQYIGTFVAGWPSPGERNLVGNPFILRPDDITEGFAIIAQRGAGKSNTAGVMEELLSSEGDQWIAIDPAAAHIGIRNGRTKDGRPKGPSGLPVLIVGGDKGDFPLNPKGGKELAQILMETKISCVIDLKHEKTSDKKYFLTELGSELLMKNKTPMHIFLDEADEIIPQQPDNSEEQEIRAVWRKVIKRGRSSGLGFTILSQRAAMVDKTSLYQIQNLIVMQLSGAGDLDMIKGWFKHNTYSNEHMQEILTAMTSLKVGEAFLLSPKVFGGVFRIEIRERVTFHAGRTPKRGEQQIEAKKYEIKEIAALFQSKLEEKKVAIADTRNREATLVQEVTTLRKQLAERVPTVITVPAVKNPEAAAKRIETAVQNAVAKRDRVWGVAFVNHERELLKHLGAGYRTLETCLRETLNGSLLSMKSGMPKFEAPVSAPEDEATLQKALTPFAPLVPQRVVVPMQGNGDGELKGSALKAVGALCQWPDGLTEGTLAAHLGLKARGGNWNRIKRSIVEPGYVERDGRKFKVTDAGRAVVGTDLPPVPLTPQEVLQLWKRTLNDSAYRAVEKLVEIYPNEITRTELGAALNLKTVGGNWNGLIRQLKQSGLATFKGNKVSANKEALLL